ncbi:MAG TPA: HD domain-containing protein [Patescibacteria group bacterium]
MKITKKLIQQIEKEALEYFVGASGCHDWSHVDRVRNLALHIGKKEKADLNMLEICAVLHDIGRRDEMKSKGKFCHAEAGAELASKILHKHKLSKEQIENIVHSIRSHRYRNSHIPSTLEAKILYDSDKLDSIGAIGVGRAFLFAGSFGSNNLYTGNEKKLAKSGKEHSYTKEDSPVLEYEIKLKHIKGKMLTKTGKAMAKQRHDFMEKFFKQFWWEIKGEK